MDMGWDYQYYQPQSDNEWLIQELVGNDDNIKRDNETNDKSYL